LSFEKPYLVWPAGEASRPGKSEAACGRPALQAGSQVKQQQESVARLVNETYDRIQYEKIKRATRDRETPLLVMDADLVGRKYHELCEALPEAAVYYAVKANPDPKVVGLLAQLGSGFEIASLGELELLLDSGVPTGRIISSNPVKNPAFIRAAYDCGITSFALDSYTEIEKLSQLAPGCNIHVRLTVSNEGSEWPLDRKFGVDTKDAVQLLLEAGKKGLKPTGIAFHVGSQCTSPAAWREAIEKSRLVWEPVVGLGIELRSINVGGGFPSKYTKPVPPMADIGQAINVSLKETFPEGVELVAEPGRAFTGEAGVMVTSVIARAVRDGQQWLYLDAGVFNGLMETIGGIRYEVFAPGKGVTQRYTLAGPSCDSMDVIAEDVELPELAIGDRVYILSAGAYTTSYASQFDGFCIPELIII